MSANLAQAIFLALVLDHFRLHPQILMEDRSGHRTQPWPVISAPGVVTHAVWDGIDGRLAHGFALIPAGKDVRPVAGQRAWNSRSITTA
jgi:hypothetical protein